MIDLPGFDELFEHLTPDSGQVGRARFYCEFSCLHSPSKTIAALLEGGYLPALNLTAFPANVPAQHEKKAKSKAATLNK
jgi:hypothetical protein